MNDRDDKLTQSMITQSGNRRFYSVGRTERLRMLGNPFFTETREMGDWTSEEIIGTAWVVFERTPDISAELMEKDYPREAFRRVWSEEMHPKYVTPLWDWMLAEEGLTEAAMTKLEVEPGKPGNQGGVGALTPQTG